MDVYIHFSLCDAQIFSLVVIKSAGEKLMIQNSSEFKNHFYIQLLSQKLLSGSELLLYMHLCNSYENALESNELYAPRQDDLAIVMDCTQPHVCNLMSNLHEYGLIDYRKISTKRNKVCFVIRQDIALNTIENLH